jgi:hypothetical protein
VIALEASPDAKSAFLQPPWWRLLLEILLSSPHLLATKWFIPSGVKVAGDGVSIPVERTREYIAFYVFFGILCAILQDCIVISFISKVMYVKLYPPTMN